MPESKLQKKIHFFTTVMDELPGIHLGGIPCFDTVQEPVQNTQPLATPHDSKKRRPPNAFLLFCSANRAKAREMNPDKRNIEISQLLGDMWKDLPDEERAPYKLKAREEQEAFKSQNPDYKYDKARLKRLAKKNGDYEPKQHLELPDIVTLVNLPPEPLREVIQILQSHLLMTCQQNLFVQQGNDPAYPQGLEEHFGHDVFQPPQ